MERWNIMEGAEVRSADDEKLGKVIATQGHYVVIEKGFFFPTDYYVPMSAVSTVDGDTVYLSVGKDEALNSGWEQTGDATFAETTDLGSAGTMSATGTIGGSYDAAAADTTTESGEVARIPVHEEELTATTRAVDQGQVRVDKDVVTEERTVDVPVTEERVRVSRHAVDRDGVADAAAFEEATIEVPVRGEVVDVQKRVHVAEEVEIAKEAERRTERVSGTVRREHVRIDDETVDTPGL